MTGASKVPNGSEVPYPQLPGGYGTWPAPFVGHETELGMARAFVERGSGEPGRVVLVNGEPGVGKTRLLSEFHRIASASGLVQLTAQCERIARGVPYAPWVDLVRQFVSDQPRTLVRTAIAPRADAVFALLPELADKVWLTPTPDWRAHPLDERAFAQQLRDLFVAMAQPHGVLMTIDDLALADSSSIELLQSIASTIRTTHLFIAVSSRDAHLDGNTALKQVVLSLARRNLLSRVDLARLDTTGVRELVASLLKQSDPLPEFVRLVYERSQGNPFFVEEIVQSLIESGSIFPTREGWEGRPVRSLRIPSSVRSVIDERLDRLAPEHRVVLTAAAVEGPEFWADLLPKTCERGEKETFDSLEAASAARLIHVDRSVDGKRVGTFTHPLIQEALYSQIPPDRRAHLHQRVGLASESALGDQAPDRAAVLAYHFLRSGDDPRALDYSILAGDRAVRLYARRDAIEHYRAALKLLERGPEGARRWRVQSRLAEQMMTSGDLQKGFDLLDEAADGFRRIGDRPGEVECLTTMTTSIDLAPDRALALIERASTLAGENPEDPLLRQVLIARSDLHYSLGRIQASREDAERALPLADAADDPRDRILTRVYLARAAPVEQIRNSFRLVGDARRIAAEKDLTDALIFIYTYEAAAIYHAEGDLARAREVGLAGLAFATQTNSAEMRAWWRGYADPLALLRSGDFATVLLRSEEARSFAAGHGEPMRVHSLFARGAAEALVGRTTNARATLESALERLVKEPRWYVEVFVNLYLGRLFLLQGDLISAGEHLTSARDLSLATGPEGWYSELYPEALALLVSVALRGNRLEEAAQLLPSLEQFAGRFDTDYIRAFSDRARAECMIGDGKTDLAIPLLKHCIDVWTRIGWKYEVARTWVELGRAHLGGGNVSAGRAALSSASDLFRGMGAAPDVAAVNSLVEQCKP